MTTAIAVWCLVSGFILGVGATLLVEWLATCFWWTRKG